MEVFSTMTLVESGGLLMHVSLELLGNFVIIVIYDTYTSYRPTMSWYVNSKKSGSHN